MRVTKAEVFSVIQRARVQKRWDKTTPEERYKHSQRMREAKAAKRFEQDAVALDGPRLPDTRISQITRAKAPPVATADSIPTVLEVFGATIPRLARERVKEQPDGSSLDYDEREYRENIERRKLRIEYYERTGQVDKATLWEAQLGKTLEHHQRASAPVIRKKLEAEYHALDSKLDAEIEAEVADMTDEELQRLEAGAESDCDAESSIVDAGTMTISELKVRIERMKAGLAEYAARPRPSQRPASTEVPTCASECTPSDIDSEESDDSGDNASARRPEPRWVTRLNNSYNAFAAKRERANTLTEPVTAPEQGKSAAAVAAAVELRAAFPDYVPVRFIPGRRDPFY
jgi:hypothetical protein